MDLVSRVATAGDLSPDLVIFHPPGDFSVFLLNLLISGDFLFLSGDFW
jgi:hypothetical protein